MLQHTLIFCICLFILTPVHAENSKPASEAGVKQLMQTTGASRMTQQLAKQMLPMLKKLAPDAPDSFWDDFLQQINQEEIFQMIVPIYQKYLTETDIQAINDFYQTPAGQKLISVQPQISRESMIAGQLWGQKIAKDLISKYQKLQDEKSVDFNDILEE